MTELDIAPGNEIGSTPVAKKPTLSVIMPVHNGERHLEEATDSVLNQSFGDLELIIVENASTDRSLEIAQQYASRDDRIRVLHSDEPGAAYALNIGLAAAQGAWFARMDADDVWLPEKLERQLLFLRNNPDIDVLGTYGWIVGKTGKRMGMFRAGPTSAEEFRRKRKADKLIYLLSPSVIFSRKAAQSTHGHDQSYAPAEDVEYWTRLADTVDVRTLEDPMVFYRIHTSSISTESFFRQTINARRATENAHRRRSGHAELSWDEYAAFRAQRPLFVKLRERLTWQSQHYYRRAGGLLAAGQPMGVLFLIASFLLNPLLPMQRMKRQRVLFTLRQRIGR